jgi:hypothetical protein
MVGTRQHKAKGEDCKAQTKGSWKSLKDRRRRIGAKGMRVNQHPLAHHKGWMVSGEETIFCWLPVP